LYNWYDEPSVNIDDSSVTLEQIIEHLKKMNKNYGIKNNLTYINGKAYTIPEVELDIEKFYMSFDKKGISINQDGSIKFFESKF
jgi:hypothetical protein